MIKRKLKVFALLLFIIQNTKNITLKRSLQFEIHQKKSNLNSVYY